MKKDMKLKMNELKREGFKKPKKTRRKFKKKENTVPFISSTMNS